MLAWLFPSYRVLYLENIRLQYENEKLRDSLDQLGRVMKVAPDPGLFSEFQDKVLQEIPFKGGKIPDDFWLSPNPEKDR